MKKLIMSVALATLLTSTAMAVPAIRRPLKFTQPDGTVIELRKVGDERRHMTVTTDGRPVLRDAQGFYCYAELAVDGSVKASEIKVPSGLELSTADRSRVNAIDVSAVKSKIMNTDRVSRYDVRRPAVVSRAGSHNGIGLMDDSFLGYTEAKGLVILVQYTDVKFDKMTQDGYFQRLLNDDGFSEYGATGSAREYFIENSNGKFTPQFDVYGPVTLSHPMAYYGGNDSDGDDLRPAQMIYDACKALDGQINFKDYDCNNDGYVDNVFVFYAGYGEASYDDEDTVWPHQWELASAGLSLTLDGVAVNKYACANELEIDYSGQFGSSIPDGIGTFVHEFSHVIGLPDLYVTKGDGDWTPATWSVLDQGPYNNNSRTPPAYSAYERNALGWCEPVVIDGPASVELEAINKSNQACIIPTGSQNEFFLIENRQQSGWDKYIPGHGMLVWHIDYNASKWQTNVVNNTKSHNCVDLEEACGYYVELDDYIVGEYYDLDAWEAALADYAFPGGKNVTSFTDDTKPSMKTWANKGLGLPITEIKEKNGVISFNVAGGACDAAVPVVSQPATVGPDYFTASWQPSEGAVSYCLTVQAKIGESVEKSVTADFGSGSKATLPDGWSFIGTNGDIYNSSGNYGEKKPSLKLSKTGYGFQTAEFDGEVRSIKFWLKGQGTDARSYLKIEAKISDVWTELARITPTNSQSTTEAVDNIPSGAMQIRVTYNKSIGNVAIDDFVVTYGGEGVVTLDGYNELEVGNVTSYRVDKLMDGVSSYIYKVLAIDASGHRTAYSDTMDVTLGSAGIIDVDATCSHRVATEGLTVVYVGLAGQTVSATDLSGRVVATVKADSNGSATMELPSGGVYIVVADTFRQKVFVR